MRTTTEQKRAVVPRRARIQGPYTRVSLSVGLKDLLGPVMTVTKNQKRNETEILKNRTSPGFFLNVAERVARRILFQTV